MGRRMTPLPSFELSASEFRHLNREFPGKRGNRDVAGRAIQIVRIYLERRPGTTVEKSSDPSSDLLVMMSDRPPFSIQVKGTAAMAIRWDELVVTGEAVFLGLARERVPLYFVMGAYVRQPQVCELLCGRDFDLVPEQRWRFRSRLRG